MFSYPFLTRALIAGVLISLSAALLGVPLVLKRYAMIGDGLSHVGFGALAIAVAVNAAPLAVAIPIVIVAAFLLLRLTENSAVKGDSAIALISTGSLAIGVMVISASTGMNVDVNSYMFGSILAMSSSDLALSIILSAVVLTLFVIFYHRIFAITFDESFAAATGLHARFYTMLIALLTALTIVIGMRLMGALLISALVIFPPLTSMRVFKSFRSVVISSAILSVCCFTVGMMISYVYSTPTGASVVCVYIAVYLIFALIGAVKGRIK
ncbi:MAG: metal ABC transporter permease [Clostridia bacterium]|nr:metal ABC transporter permease [Clostridia bacterium]